MGEGGVRWGRDGWGVNALREGKDSNKTKKNNPRKKSLREQANKTKRAQEKQNTTHQTKKGPTCAPQHARAKTSCHTLTCKHKGFPLSLSPCLCLYFFSSSSSFPFLPFLSLPPQKKPKKNNKKTAFWVLIDYAGTTPPYTSITLLFISQKKTHTHSLSFRSLAQFVPCTRHLHFYRCPACTIMFSLFFLLCCRLPSYCTETTNYPPPLPPSPLSFAWSSTKNAHDDPFIQFRRRSR